MTPLPQTYTVLYEILDNPKHGTVVSGRDSCAWRIRGSKTSVNAVTQSALCSLADNFELFAYSFQQKLRLMNESSG